MYDKSFFFRKNLVYWDSMPGSVSTEAGPDSDKRPYKPKYL